jgi:hypothetical protein
MAGRLHVIEVVQVLVPVHAPGQPVYRGSRVRLLPQPDDRPQAPLREVQVATHAARPIRCQLHH